MSTDAEWQTTEAMIRYGGSFVSHLGELFRMADMDNKRKLVAAFPDYFEEYRQMAILIEQRKASAPHAGSETQP